MQCIEYAIIIFHSKMKIAHENLVCYCFLYLKSELSYQLFGNISTNN